MDVHPDCEIFPMMDRDEFASLCDDIAKRGLLWPIIIYQGQIVDGRNRQLACERLDIPPRYEEWDGRGGTLLEFIVSTNRERRHLTKAQSAALAAELKPRLEDAAIDRCRAAGKKGGKKTGRRNGMNGCTKGPEKIPDPSVNRTKSHDSRDEAAEKFQVNPRYVDDAAKIKKQAPEVFEEMKTGKVTMCEAKRKAGLAPARKAESSEKTEPETEPDDEPQRMLQPAPSRPSVREAPALNRVTVDAASLDNFLSWLEWEWREGTINREAFAKFVRDLHSLWAKIDNTR